MEWNAGTSGITWQARDGFPLYAGTPLLAGILIPHTSMAGFGDFARRRVAAIVAIAVGVCQLADFGWTLRRFTVGLGRTVNLFQPVKHGWSPPLGTPLTALLGAVAVVAYAWWLFIRTRGHGIGRISGAVPMREPTKEPTPGALPEALREPIPATNGLAGGAATG
jgi:hypothetical protein